MEGRNFVKIDQFKRIQGATLILGEKHYPVYKGINTVGRNKIAVINIKHLNVSQNQAIIVIVDNNQHFISDLNSSNGTFLHNAKLVPFKLYELTNKADVKFGDVEGIYNKVTENDSTVMLQDTLEMTQNMTQNFYASNTQLVIDTSTLNHPDEHNYSTISLQRNQQPNVIEDIHDMATQVEEYPPQYKPTVNFAIPVAKPMGNTQKESVISDIHDAPTQVISFPDCSSQRNIENVPESIEIMEATQVMNYPVKCNIQIITETTGTPNQAETKAKKDSVNDQTEIQVAEKSNSSSEVSSERTQLVSSEEPANMTNQINTLLHNHQKIVLHNSQVPSTSGLRNVENCEIEDSFTDMKNMGTQGVIDETHIQPDEGSNDSLDFFTMNKIDHAENKGENNTNGGNSNSKDVPKINNDTVNPEPVRKTGSGSNLHLSVNKNSTESGSETDIEDLEDIPKNKLNDEIESTQDIGPRKKPLKRLESDDDTDSTSEICYKKKPLKKLVSDDTDSTQEICRKKKPLKKLESDDDTDSNEDFRRKKKPLKKLDSDDLDIDLSPSKKQKLDCSSTKIDKDCVSDSETDCEDEIVNKKIEASDNKKQGLEAKCDDSDTDIEDNEEEQAISIAQKTLDDLERSMQLKDSSKLEESGLNDTDCIPATQDAFAEAFSYRSSKSQTNDNHSSEEESFKLGITQLMEDGSQNKVEESSENKQPNAEISIPVNTEDIRQVNEVTRNDNSFLEPTQKIYIAKDKISKQSEAPEDPNSSKNDEIYIMPTQKINTEQNSNIQTGFKVPEKKFTFRKKTAILEESLTTILSNDIEEDVYMAATQQIGVSIPQKPENDGSVFEQATQKLNAENDEDDDVFLQPTQCLNVGPQKHSEVSKDDDVYSLSTQQIHVESSHKATDAEEKKDENDMYMLETQILPEMPDNASKSKTDSSEKIFSDQTKEILADPPIILNDISIVSDEIQSGMHCSEENHSRPGNPVIRVLNKELLIEVESKASKHPDKTEMNVSSSRSKFTKKSDIRNLQEKIKADMEKDDAETLSQIEAFVKKPLEVEESKEVVEQDDAETLSQIEAFIKKPLDANDSRVRRSVRRDHNLSDQETIRTDDVNQSFALLETKTSKTRRQPKIAMSIDDIKVTVTSHRRSMSVAETSMKEALDESSRIARKSRRVNVNNNVETSGTTRGKRKSERTKENKIVESDSEAEVPTKISRRNSVTKKSSTDTATKRSSRVVTKIADQNIIGTIYEEPSSSSNSRETSNNNENKADSDRNVISSVLTINLKRKRISRLKSTESDGKGSNNSDECESALKGDSRAANQNSRSRENYVDNKSSTPPKKRISRLKVQSEVSTPTRSKRPVSDESLLGSAERSRRKQRPKVVFTMLDNPQLELYIKHLGGSVVDGVDACTVLVTKEVKRSQKLLAAVAQGKPICSPNWIKDSKKSNEFLDPWDFILIDKEAESKWNFSLRESLDRANCKKLLTNYTFQLMVSKAADVLKGAIEASGGKCVARNPGKNYEGHFVVVSSPENKSKYSKLKKQNPDLIIVEPEAIFDGVLRQELRFSKYLLT